MRVTFRHIGGIEVSGANWSEQVEWPVVLRIPVVGEMVDLRRGQYTVQRVQWFNLTGQVHLELIVE